MKSLLSLTILIVSICGLSQNFLNGSFEINAADSNMINMHNRLCDSVIYATKSFGGIQSPGGPLEGNIDLIRDPEYCDTYSYDGNWYVALTGGGSDRMSMQLSTTIHIGDNYTISFFDKACPNIANSVNTFIGISSDPDVFGDTIFVGPLPTADSIWIQRSFNFTATQDASYITVQTGGPNNGHYSWHHYDNFEILDGVHIDLGSDTTICLDQVFELDVHFQGASYFWSTGDTTSRIIVGDSGIYWVHIDLPNGKSISDTIRIYKEDCEKLPLIEMPNVFTPNNDGINEFFGPIFCDNCDSYEMQIYNRWGNLIFQSNSHSPIWNGKFNNESTSEGVYFYIINVSGVNGQRISESGSFHLIR